MELSLAVVISQLLVWWAMILCHIEALLQPLMLHSHKQWAEHDCQHDASILPLFQEFGSSLILLVVAITHYYNFIYNENRIMVKLGMILSAFFLPQKRSGYKLLWLLVLNAELISITLFFHLKWKNITSTFLKSWGSVSWRSGQVGCLYEGRMPTPQLQQMFIGSIFWCKTESLPQGASPTF